MGVGTAFVLGACFTAIHGCSDTPATMADSGSSDAGIAIPDSAKRPDATKLGDAGGIDGASILRGEWKEIPGLPSLSCLYAVEPAKSVDPLTWEPCTGGQTGCERLKVTWTPYRNGLTLWNAQQARLIGGKPYFLSDRTYPSADGPGYEHIFEAEDLQGNVVFAVYSTIAPGTYPDSCYAGGGSIGDSSFVVTASLATDKELLRPIWQPLGHTDQTRSIEITTAAVGNKVQGALVAGNGARVIGTALLSPSPSAGATLYMADMLSDKIVPSKSNYPNMGGPVTVAGGAIVLTGGGFGFLSNDNELTQIYEPAPGASVWAVAVDQTDGDRIVWVELVAQDELVTTYWTAPLTKTANSIVPRRITRFVDTLDSRGWGMAVGNGLIVDGTYSNRVLLTRISDGWSWEVPTPPGEQIYRGIWADADFVWTGRGASETVAGATTIHSYGMFRFSRASLGPPTIPPS